MTMDAPQPIHSIPFPAITICHPQSVIEYKAKIFIEKMYVFVSYFVSKLIQYFYLKLLFRQIPAESSKAEVLDAFPVLGVFVEHQFEDTLTEQLQLVDKVLALNGLSVLDAVQELGLVIIWQYFFIKLL